MRVRLKVIFIKIVPDGCSGEKLEIVRSTIALKSPVDIQ